MSSPTTPAPPSASSSSSSLAQRLAPYIEAAFTGLWVHSHEHPEALRELAALCRHRSWSLATWDVDRGLRVMGADPAASADTSSTDPLAAIRCLPALAPGPEHPQGSALLVLVNFHRFLHAAEVVQALAHQVQRGKQDRTFVLILSSVVQVPVELEKLLTIVEHDLPDRRQLLELARGVATEPGELPPAGDSLDPLLDAAAGLTRLEAENAFSLALVRHSRLEPKTVWELKAQALEAGGLLTLHRGAESFADLGGLEAMKAFCTRSLSRRADRHPSARPRGVLLLSPPGCGKSAFCRALGNETGRPTLVLDVGALFGGLVGQTEQNVRQALRVADAMAPCVLMIDELEKAFAGVGGGSQGDGGVSSRLFGTFLTWLSDHTSDVYVVCTSNDVSRLPPEFGRAERFDGLFFLDTPTAAERQQIWPIHLGRYGIKPEQAKPDDRQWTGAEVQSCCRLCALLGVPLTEAAKHVVPVAATAAESLERLRAWAAGRCLDAGGRGGLYVRGAPAPASRKVSRPSAN